MTYMGEFGFGHVNIEILSSLLDICSSAVNILYWLIIWKLSMYKLHLKPPGKMISPRVLTYIEKRSKSLRQSKMKRPER